MSQITISYSSNNLLSLSGIDSLNLHHTLMCGQAFRWKKDGDFYIGVVKEHVLKVRQEGDSIEVKGYPKEGLEAFVFDYFDLNKDYSEIEDKVSSFDEHLATAVAFGKGLRLLRQDPWECLISFIISARNNIPCIRRSIEAISMRYGDRYEFEGGFYYLFPSPAQLSQASLEGLLECGTAFRGKYIIETVKRVFESGIDLEELRDMELTEARKVLMEFKGVGEKVADCVLLFALQRYEAFPIDIWINRVMRRLYFDGKEVSLKKMQEYAQERFREYAGYAQEYLYYWARSNQLS